MSDKPLYVDCPTCHKHVQWSESNPFRPFCSERCKLIDLGEWASEEHRIAGEPAVPNIDQIDDMSDEEIAKVMQYIIKQKNGE